MTSFRDSSSTASRRDRRGKAHTVISAVIFFRTVFSRVIVLSTQGRPHTSPCPSIIVVYPESPFGLVSAAQEPFPLVLTGLEF
jgi:hypothetical protein